MELDLSRQLVLYLNTLDLFTFVTEGDLNNDESISVILMPGGTETLFFDGIKDRNQNLQINAKSRNQQTAKNTLSRIQQNLEELIDLPSGNGSYEFQHFTTNSMPSLLMVDKQEYFTYEMSLTAKITIYGSEKN